VSTINRATRHWSGVGLLVLVMGSVGSLAPLHARAAAASHLDRLWQDRADPRAVAALIDAGVARLRTDPDDYDTAWRTARAQWWAAHFETDPDRKAALALDAVTTAERAADLQPNRVEGHFLAAVAVAEYATTIGVLRALAENVLGRLESAARRAYEIDRDFDNGGPMSVLGRYYAAVPWPKRDLGRSRQLLEELKARHPGAVNGRFYLAETYHAMGEPDLAEAELRFVLQPDMSAGLDLESAETRRLAAQRLSEWFPSGRPPSPVSASEGG